MASGSFSSSTGVQCNVRVEWSSTKNISNNSSTVTMTAYLDFYAPLNFSNRNLTFSCDGQTKTVAIGSVSDSGSGLRHRQLASQSFTVSHNNDGTKSCYIGISIPLNITYSGKYLGTITAGRTSTLDQIERHSTIINLGNFDVEGWHWLDYQKGFDAAYMDLYLWAWKVGTDETTGVRIKGDGWDGYWGNYASGEHMRLNSKQRADIYKIAMPDTAIWTEVNVRYILKTYTGASGNYVGEDSKVVRGIIRGNLNVNVNGEWKSCIPFVRIDGSWKPCSTLIKNFGSWKDGQPY